MQNPHVIKAKKFDPIFCVDSKLLSKSLGFGAGQKIHEVEKEFLKKLFNPSIWLAFFEEHNLKK